MEECLPSRRIFIAAPRWTEAIRSSCTTTRSIHAFRDLPRRGSLLPSSPVRWTCSDLYAYRPGARRAQDRQRDFLGFSWGFSPQAGRTRMFGPRTPADRRSSREDRRRERSWSCALFHSRRAGRRARHRGRRARLHRPHARRPGGLARRGRKVRTGPSSCCLSRRSAPTPTTTTT